MPLLITPLFIGVVLLVRSLLLFFLMPPPFPFPFPFALYYTSDCALVFFFEKVLLAYILFYSVSLLSSFQMFRRNFIRLTHQTVKEPLGHEENTFARGKRSLARSLHHMRVFSAVTGVGCIAALYTFYANHQRQYLAVLPNGKMGKTTPPVMWWNY